MKHSKLFGMLMLGALIAACDDTKVTTPATNDAATPGQGTDAAASIDGGASDAATAPTWSVVAPLDPAAFELAEGLVVHAGSAYATLAPLGKILKIAPDGTRTTYATIPAGYNDGYATGLVFDDRENLFVLATRNSPSATGVVPGIYKIPPTIGGGAVTTPFAVDPEMVFPNSAAFDARGNLLVTDSATGVVFAVAPSGAVTKWATGPLLQGSPACPAPLPFPIGANGILVSPTEVVVANTAKGSIVRIAVDADGSAGAQTTIVQDCQYVGLDGLARDADGTILAAQNGLPGRILRITAAGTVRVVHDGAPLDGPASIAIADGWRGERVALVTSSAFFSVGADGGAPKPALLRFGPLP